MTFSPSQDYQSVFISSPSFEGDNAYTILYGGSSSGDIRNGIYQNGAYSAGNTLSNFTMSDVFKHIQE